MKHIISRLSAAATAVSLSAAPLYAQGWDWGSLFRSFGDRYRHGGGSSTSSVPEIDASAGLLAIAAVLAVMLLVWERRRRSA